MAEMPCDERAMGAFFRVRRDQVAARRRSVMRGAACEVERVLKACAWPTQTQIA